MLISVITVCRNAEEFIEQCVRSVVAQDFDDFEYVVIDGGSTDGTVDVIRRYDSSLAYWHSKPDRGLAHAFNQGVEHSSGEWLLFLNSDDFFADSTALSRMAGHLAQHEDADVVFGQVQLATREPRPKPVLKVGKPWRWSEFRRRDTIPHPAAFTNRKLFKRVGGFSEEWRIAIDYEHYLRAGKDLSAVSVPELVSWMRIDGISRAQASQTLGEVKLAQQRHKAWRAAWMAEVVYEFYRARGGLRRLAERLLAR